MRAPSRGCLSSVASIQIHSNSFQCHLGVSFVASNPQRRSLLQVAKATSLVVVFATTGCKDGPFYELKKLNPVIRSQWNEDRARRPVFHQRMDEYANLRASIRGYPDSEQARYIEVLTDVCETETSPEIRRQIALVYSEVLERDDAIAGMMSLSRDGNPKVRLTVAEHLSKAPAGEATKTLMAMAASDQDENIRNIATESLGMHRTDEVKSFLTKQLDSRQVGTQYSAYQALSQQTGKNFGGEVSKMRAYIGGEDVAEEKPSFWASPIDYLYTR